MSKRDTRRTILDTALKLFRKKGFDATTMREIAEGAGVSLGAAYYYFSSKEAIVLAYFAEQMAEAERRLDADETPRDLGERLRRVFHGRLDLMRRDQRFFGGLLRSVGDPASSVSVFSRENRELRLRAILAFRRTLDGTRVPSKLHDPLALGLWVLLLGLTLYFVYDHSPRQARTWRLADRAVDRVVGLVPLLSLPGAGQLVQRVMGVLEEADLVEPLPREEDHRSSSG
jgi:AcrR family transcriptional regulator